MISEEEYIGDVWCLEVEDNHNFMIIRENKIAISGNSTSELFGGLTCPEGGYDEGHPFHPRSPYAVAKAAAYYAVVNYREAYNIFACNGILFNHSSERRGYDFATRKITRGVAKIKLGLEKTIKMGDLSAYRDESHAKDMVKGMHLMLAQETPDDYVLASGRSESIKYMLEKTCQMAGLKFENVYEMDDRFMRPSEVMFLKGDAQKARKVLGWEPEYNLDRLLEEMYRHDLYDLQG